MMMVKALDFSLFGGLSHISSICLFCEFMRTHVHTCTVLKTLYGELAHLVDDSLKRFSKKKLDCLLWAGETWVTF